MKIYFPAYIDAAADGSFGVVFPDVPGCFSAGDTIEDAIGQAEQALALHLEMLRDLGRSLPAPGTVGKARRERPRNAIIALVPGRLPAKLVRLNITMDEDLVRELDSITTNRSRYISEAITDKLRGRESKRGNDRERNFRSRAIGAKNKTGNMRAIKSKRGDSGRISGNEPSGKPWAKPKTTGRTG